MARAVTSFKRAAESCEVACLWRPRVSTHGHPEHDYDDQGTEHIACVDAFEASAVGSVAIKDCLCSV
jgi:hypothetical protein